MGEITLESRTAPGGPQVAETGELLLQLCGGWSSTLRLADPDQRDWTGAAVTLHWLGQELVGVVESQAVMEGKSTVFVVGGGGKLLAEVPAKHYANSTPHLIAQEAVEAAGEKLATDRLPAATLFQFPRRRAPLADVLDDLARACGCLWGVYPDGRVWFGAPAWTPAPEFDADELDADSIYQYADYKVREFGPLPGQTLGGRRIGCARYTLSPERDTELRVWFQAEGLDLDNDALRTGLATFIRQTIPLAWLGKYPSTVRAVRSNGTWDVELDEKRLPPLVGVRPRVFAPGAKVVPPAGSRVEVSFEQYDPRYPVADLFEPGDAQRGVARKDDTVQVDLYYTTGADPDGGTFVQTLSPTGPGTKITLQGKITSASDRALLP